MWFIYETKMTGITQVSYTVYTNVYILYILICLNEKFMYVLNCCETNRD